MKSIFLLMVFLVACNVTTKQEQEEKGYRDDQEKSTTPNDYSRGTQTRPQSDAPEPGQWMGH